MPILYMLVGAGFSGKSTLSKKIAEYFDIELVSLDQLYFDKKDEMNLDQDSDEDWETLGEMCKEVIRSAMFNGESIVFDNTNLTRSERNQLRKIARDVDGRAVVIYMDTPKELLDKRQAANKLSGERHDVKQEYLDEAIAELEIPDSDEEVYSFKPDTDLNEFLKSLPR